MDPKVSYRQDRGTWRCTWTDRDGRHHRTFATEEEAQAFAKAMVAAPGRGPAALLIHDPDPSLLVASREYLRHQQHRLAPSTLRTRAQILAWLLRSIPEGTTVRGIDQATAEEYLLGELARGVSPSTANSRRGALSGAWVWFVRQGWTPANPWKGLEPFATRPDSPPILPPSRIGEYLDASPPWFRPLAAVALYAGLRKCEVIALRWFDVDLKRGWLSIRSESAKGGKARRVPIAHPLARILEALPKASECVFPTKYGMARTFDQSHLRRTAKVVGERLGVYGLTYHSLRATCLTALAESGTSEEVIRRIAGHSKTTITRIYLRPAEEDLVRAVERLGSEFDPRVIPVEEGMG